MIKSPKANFFTDSIKKILNIFSLSFLITLILGSYLLVLISGYVKGRKDSNEYFLKYLENKKFSIITPTPTKVPELTPTKTLLKKEGKFANWGGPELWLLVNKKREEYGVNPLDQRGELCTIASIRLNELLDLGNLDGHQGFSNMQEQRKDLDWIFDRYSVIAEFLAMGGDTPEETVELWDNTLGHKKILTGGEYVWGCIYAQNTFAVAIVAY